MVCMNHIQVRSQSRSVLPLNYGEEDEVIKMFFFLVTDTGIESKSLMPPTLIVSFFTTNATWEAHLE